MMLERPLDIRVMMNFVWTSLMKVSSADSCYCSLTGSGSNFGSCPAPDEADRDLHLDPSHGLHPCTEHYPQGNLRT